MPGVADRRDLAELLVAVGGILGDMGLERETRALEKITLSGPSCVAASRQFAS
jgi:hypothetical protein